MEDNKYFIFSDEAGSWGNKSSQFYIRSWIKIKDSDFYRLVGVWETKKLPFPTKESLLKNSQEINNILEREHLVYFFTFTKLNEFYLRKFNIKNKLMEQLSIVMSQLEYKLKTYMKDQIPSKVKSAINYVLFLNMYEAFHIENAYKTLHSLNEKSTFVMDKPQFSEGDYLKIFKDKTKENESELIFSHKKEGESYNLGIHIADALASLGFDLLKLNETPITDYFKKYILPKSLAGNIGLNGFNKVFYPVNRSYGNDKLFAKEEMLIKSLSTKLS